MYYIFEGKKKLKDDWKNKSNLTENFWELECFTNKRAINVIVTQMFTCFIIKMDIKIKKKTLAKNRAHEKKYKCTNIQSKCSFTGSTNQN